MTVDEVMAHLRSRAKESTALTYQRHGAHDPLGVSFAELEKLKKQIKRDHALALQLWDQRYMEARTLACFIADPSRFSSTDLDSWIGELTEHGLIDCVVGNIVAKGPHAQSKLPQWTRSSDEYVGRAGWVLLAHLAKDNPNLPDSYFEAYLDKIPTQIEKAPNRKKQAMHLSIIAIGIRSEALAKKAITTARTVGPIEIDHGETDCKTPEAEAYIKKAWARKKNGKTKSLHIC
jgi:3-methyladenine DNA glycosylase AlkD